MTDTDNLASRIYAARILVVDDDIDALDLMETALTQRGYKNVYVASDPTAVARMFQIAPCDLVLLDLDMPHMDGIGVMRQVKTGLSRGDYTPVIVVSGKEDIESRLSAWKEGARDYIVKPFYVDEFLQRVYNHIEVRMLFNGRKRA